MCLFFCSNPQITQWLDLHVHRACRSVQQLCPVNPHQDYWHDSPLEPAEAPSADNEAQPSRLAAPMRTDVDPEETYRPTTDSARPADFGTCRGRALIRASGRLAAYDRLDSLCIAASPSLGEALCADPGDRVLCPTCGAAALAEARYCDVCGEPLWLAATQPGSVAERTILLVARCAATLAFVLFAACLVSFMLPPHSQLGLVLAIVAYGGFLLARQAIRCLSGPALGPAAPAADVDAAPH